MKRSSERRGRDLKHGEQERHLAFIGYPPFSIIFRAGGCCSRRMYAVVGRRTATEPAAAMARMSGSVTFSR